MPKIMELEVLDFDIAACSFQASSVDLGYFAPSARAREYVFVRLAQSFFYNVYGVVIEWHCSGIARFRTISCDPGCPSV